MTISAEVMTNEADVEDRRYNVGEISEKTGLQKTANGWVKPKKGGAGTEKAGSNSERINKSWKQSDVISSLPNGWKRVEGATTAPNGYVVVSNNKSRFGGERETKLMKEEDFKKLSTSEGRPKAIRWDRNNLNEMRGNEEYINAKAADNYYHQYGLDKIGEWKDRKGWTVKEYQNDDGETYRAKYNGEKYVGSEYDPTGEILSPESKPVDVEKMSIKELKAQRDKLKSGSGKENDAQYKKVNDALTKKRLQTLTVGSEVKAHGTPLKITKINPDTNTIYGEFEHKGEKMQTRIGLEDIDNYDDILDSAPRVLTGDCRIRVRKA